ncbi:MAG: M56 family metallopeptidase [Kofleriaceae bacterium]|nr:M56 family metallopeptidase [Kofleriaceae bacterium]
MTLVAAGAAAKGVMATLGMMALQGTLLAVLALVLVRGGRLRPAWQAGIWLVVLAKFVLPWGPAMPWSLADLIATLRGGEAAGPLLVAPVAGSEPAVTASTGPALAWVVLASAWGLGTAYVLARSLAAQRAAVRIARQAPRAPADAQQLVHTLARRAKVRTPGLVVGAQVTGPYVVGMFRAIIVVPPALLAEPALLRAALLHELAHVRRRDALGRVVQIAAHAMFFFWPVVRLVGKRLDLAREAACDAWALEAGDLPRPAYARLLVKMAGLRSAAPMLALAAYGKTLDARVAAVLGPPARARLGAVHRLALLAWVALALGGARSAAARGAPETCRYTPQLAESLMLAYPEADLDGDGVLSRDEACEFQAEARQVSTMDDAAAEEYQRLLAEPLCCNCSPGDGLIPSAGPVSTDATCQ